VSPQPTHHGYAVNVKDHVLYSEELQALPENECEALYQAHVEAFWLDAQSIGEQYGFAHVYSEGRMGGYAVPDPQPDTDNLWPEQVDAWVRDTFEPFARDIEALVVERREMFLADARETIADNARTARNNELARKVWRS
jgi:hypothetical protein